VAQASARNLGTCSSLLRENSKRKPRKDKSTDAEHRGGATRSSDESFVMKDEQRGSSNLV